VFKNVVRGFVGFPQKSQIFVGDFSLVLHDPKGSHYGNFGGEWVLKLNEANPVLNLRQN